MPRYQNPNAITKQTHPTLIALAMLVYPNYRGRKFEAVVRERYRVWDCWDGGSRSACGSRPDGGQGARLEREYSGRVPIRSGIDPRKGGGLSDATL